MSITLFNDGWQFAKHKPENWTQVTLPHDWLIYDTKNLYETSIGWYKKELDGSVFNLGQRVILRFDGVYMDSTLFVNGKNAGEWKYGYTAFEHDITDFLNANGVNELLLKVDYKSPNSRWYSGAGIYRDVFLKIKNSAHFVSDGIYVTPKKLDETRWQVEVDAEINVATKDTDYEIRHTINGKEWITLKGTGSGTANLTDNNSLIVENPQLWDIESPNLYTLKSELLINGEIMDECETRFGFRELSFTSNDGFFLNSKPVRLNGVCLHHDLGSLGAAVDKNAIKRQLLILRKMGVNAIRTSHNPPAAAFMELTDEMGFLVMSELLDMWELPKTEYDYARFFDAWVEKDAASWIRRDRNCPSVIMWSVGNEIYDTHADFKRGSEILKRLMGYVLHNDPKKHAPITLCSNYMPWGNTQGCADIIKLMGYNYGEHLYDEHHKAHPDWIIYGSETGSTVQSRGVYHFPLSKTLLADDDLQCSSLGNSSTSWGAENVEKCITDDRDAHFSLGQFIWSGIDYIGEPTPYHTKNSYFGHIDTAGFPKDSFYIFASAWTDYKKSPMVHIFPYWDFSPGQKIDVRVCSNAPKVELFLNNNSLGTYEIDHKNGHKLVGDWVVPFSAGELKALAYDENGIVVAETVRKSFGDAVSTTIKTERIGNLAFCEISTSDINGNTVENANNRVKVIITGGELIGLDNGDSADFDQYKTDSRRLFNGKLLAIARVTDEANFNIEVKMDESDIPIRKIELTADGYNVHAKILPENASYNDLVWRLTDAGGIDSPLGTITVSPNGTDAVITPKGDGEVYVRCAAKNGKEHVTLISHITLEITGMGKPFLDPYSFVSGGLYNRSFGEITIGNERGISTSREGVSHVGFADLDFGDYGSDEFTIPIFTLDKSPFEFEVWEGMPSEGGIHITNFTYDLGSIWNTYIEASYKLPKRLRGVTTLCFVFNRKIHIKGFKFNKLEKAYQKIYAPENDSIYGDSFTIKPDAIENIGNNVSIIFKNMDFGATGTKEVEICSRSVLDKNSFQFVFSGEDGEISQMVEVQGSLEYKTDIFKINSFITGKTTVSLIFLPGCNFDLTWFKFKKADEI